MGNIDRFRVHRLQIMGICVTIEIRKFEDIEAWQLARKLTRSPDLNQDTI